MDDTLPPTGTSRWRRPLSLLVALALAATVAACGSDDGGDTAAGDADAAGADAFPVTIGHTHGETTIEEAPERIVTVGLTEQDVLLALGIVPVATTEWFGEHPGAIWPWAQDEFEALDAEVPEVLAAGALNVEAVAAQQPDLILAVYGGLTAEEYGQLSEIAPTVAQPADLVDYGVSWEELTRTVGLAVGKADEADALVAEVEAAFAEVVDANPEFDGASSVVATPYEGIYVYGPEDARGRFLTDLGFELPADLAAVTGEEFGGNLSLERVDLLDVDALVWLDVPAEEQTGDNAGDLGELYLNLGIRDEGREVFLDSFSTALGGATSFVTVLSLPFLLDGLVPMLAAAVDGDPATVVPPTEE